MNFEDWLISIGKSTRTAQSYSGAIAGVMSGWAADEGVVTQSLHELTNVNDFRQACEVIRQLPTYVARNTRGNGMYSASLNSYTDYLADVTQNDLEQDLSQIVEDTTLSNTEKTILVNTRIGQGQFRKALIKQWGGCAVTGYQDTRYLVASHIKPWAASEPRERLDPFNGLLLLPNLDKVFDLGYISFEGSGAIRISKEFEDYEALGIHVDQKASLSSQHQGYLEYHRNVVFKS